MSLNDELGKRMKNNYEGRSDTKLVRRMPVILRLDGKAFHTFTKGFNKPFDDTFIKSMQITMRYLCENVQGCVLGYTQSDEISLLLIDYATLTTEAWFDYRIQKMCSVAAAMATGIFNRAFSYHSDKEQGDKENKSDDAIMAHIRAMWNIPVFDCRCFNIPKEEVTNYFYWRQLDATRNSIQMVGQSQFSYRELMNKSCSDIQDMLHEQKGINWNDLETHKKRGSCCVKGEEGWVIDAEIPIFKSEDREYIERFVNIGE